MDHCTLWLEGWWSHCCEAHDAAYSAQAGRALADGQLLACVAASLPSWAVDHPLLTGAAGLASLAVSGIMFVGVRAFGRRFYRKAA